MSYVPGFAVRTFGSWAQRLSSLRRQLAGWVLFSIAQASWAVSDLPGGPAVRQLDLHPPVTRIAAEQQWLHYMMLYICGAIFLGVFGGLIAFGFIGLLIGPTLLAVGYSLLLDWSRNAGHQTL